MVLSITLNSVILVLYFAISQIFCSTIVSNIPVIVTNNKNFTSSNPTWLTSPYFRADNQKVISVLTGSTSTPTYTFTFSSALPGLPYLAYGVKNYKGNDYFGQQFFEIKKTGLTPSTFSVAIQIYGITNLWILTVAYLAADPTFPHHLNTFDNIPVNYSNGDVVTIQIIQVNISEKSTSATTYYTNYINYTAQAAGRTFTRFTPPYNRNTIVLFMTALWIRATFRNGNNYYPIQLHISNEVLNETHYYWNLTLRINVLITNIHFSQVIFNSQDVQSSQRYYIVYLKWYNDINGGFLEVPQQFVDNFIMAVTAFETVDGYCGFQYNWEFVTKTVNGVNKFGVELQYSWTPTNTCGFSWSQTSVLYIQTWLCQAPYYYFNLTSNLCQTLCGGYHVQNNGTYTCEPCANTQCYICSDPETNLCLQCATYKNYELVNGNCVCMYGHFQTGATCETCSGRNTGCLNCSYNDGAGGTLAYNSALYNCLLCNNNANYFLVGRFCTLCTLGNCSLCLNLTACITCVSTHNLTVASTCIVCSVVGCAYCTQTDGSKCGICNETAGYYMNSSQKCVTRCGDGIYVVANQSCDDGNVVSLDGCSSTCTLQSYFTCSGSPSTCFFQSSVSVQLNNSLMETDVCNTMTLIVKITPISNTFAQSSIQWNNFVTTQNTSTILYQNTSMTKYLNGYIYYSYRLNRTIQNETLQFSTNFSNLLPDSNIFVSTISPNIIFIVNPTSQKKAFLQCCRGYELDQTNTSCHQICGDGILFDLGCDDGNLQNGDGCNDVCQIQEGYVCVNGTNITLTICYFNGTITLDILEAIKSPTSNHLLLKYSIGPIDPILNIINGSYDFLPYLSYPSNPQVTVLSAIYDPITGELTVNLAYNASIEDSNLTLAFTAPVIPTAFAFPNFTNSWSVNPTNHLSPTFYDESVYQRVKLFEPIFTALMWCSLGVFVMAIITRKYLGLELTFFLQMVYLSILFSRDLRPEYQNVTLWQYIFGYNYFYMTPITRNIIEQPYIGFGYTKYFGHSNNIMIILTACIYVLGLFFYMASGVTTKTISRRLQSIGNTLMNQVGYCFMLFCTPSIITAICIQIKQNTILDTSLVWSKALLVIALILIFVGNVLNFLNLSQNADIGTFYRKHSNFGLYAPVIFAIKCNLLPILTYLFTIYQLPSISLIMTLQVVFIIFIAFGRPHKKILDLVRGLVLETSLLFILTNKYLYNYMFDQVLTNDHKIYEILFLCQVILIAIVVGVTVVSLIYHFIHNCKKNRVNPETVQENNQLNSNVAIPQESPQPQPEVEKPRKKAEKPDKIKKIEDNMSSSFEKISPLMSPTKKANKSPDSDTFIFDVDEIETGANSSNYILDKKRDQKKLKKFKWQS